MQIVLMVLVVFLVHVMFYKCHCVIGVHLVVDANRVDGACCVIDGPHVAHVHHVAIGDNCVAIDCYFVLLVLMVLLHVFIMLI
jgi:hypothetical protein